MKTSVLEFKINDEIFCFNTKNVDYVFELEKYTKFEGVHKSVIGIVKYNQDVMPLIDTLEIYSQKRMDYTTPKSVIVIHDKNDDLYGMVVDEILKTEALDKVASNVNLSTQETKINHYIEDEKIVNEIEPIPLLENNHIISMKKFSQSKTVNTFIEKNKEDYLVFRIKESYYAIESKQVKEVIENEGQVFQVDDKDIYGVIAVRNEVVTIVNLEEPDDLDSTLIIEKDLKKMAVLVDEVFDIESFDTYKIESINTNKATNAFYNFNSQIVALLNLDFYLDKINKKEKIDSEDTKHLIKNEFLIFYIGGDKFAIDMDAIRHVTDSESLSKTEASSIIEDKHAKFIATWNHKAISVVDISDLLGVNLSNIKDNQVIFIEKNNCYVGFMVDDVEDIVYLNNEEIKEANHNNDIVDGAIVLEDQAVIKLNEEYILSLL